MVTEENQVSTHATLDARERTGCQQERFKQETQTNEQAGEMQVYPVTQFAHPLLMTFLVMGVKCFMISSSCMYFTLYKNKSNATPCCVKWLYRLVLD